MSTALSPEGVRAEALNSCLKQSDCVKLVNARRFCCQSRHAWLLVLERMVFTSSIALVAVFSAGR